MSKKKASAFPGVHGYGFRRWFAWRLRFIADRIGPEDAMSGTSWTYYYKDYVGVVFDTEGKKGCPLWGIRSQHDKAHVGE